MRMSRRRTVAAALGLIAVALSAYLAFGVFGIHTAFIDEEVDEAGPVFASGAQVAGESVDTGDPAPVGDRLSNDEADPDPARPPADESASDPATVAPTTTQALVRTVATGSFVDSRIHAGSGDAVVLTDGAQTFLRFEENFATDNGPDLNVYLRADDGSFVDLGDLKGNIGSQNYEIPTDVDLTRYRTVDIWCVRFGVSFTTADLT